jgi:hypothetical protein
MIQSNSKIFTDTLFGTSTNKTAEELSTINRNTQETYLGSSSFSNMATKVCKVPSNQRVAKGS